MLIQLLLIPLCIVSVTGQSRRQELYADARRRLTEHLVDHYNSEASSTNDDCKSHLSSAELAALIKSLPLDLSSEQPRLDSSASSEEKYRNAELESVSNESSRDSSSSSSEDSSSESQETDSSSSSSSDEDHDASKADIEETSSLELLDNSSTEPLNDSPGRRNLDIPKVALEYTNDVWVDLGAKKSNEYETLSLESVPEEADVTLLDRNCVLRALQRDNYDSYNRRPSSVSKNGDKTDLDDHESKRLRTVDLDLNPLRRSLSENGPSEALEDEKTKTGTNKVLQEELATDKSGEATTNQRKLNQATLETQLTNAVKVNAQSGTKLHVNLLVNTRLCYACSSLNEASCWSPNRATTIKYCGKGKNACITKTFKTKNTGLVLIRDCDYRCDSILPILDTKYKSCTICASDLCNDKVVSGAYGLTSHSLLFLIFITFITKYIAFS